MMEAIKALIESGMFSVIDILLIGVIGILLYLITAKQKNNETTLSSTIEGMQALIEEERLQTQTLSKTVYSIRVEMEKEREEKWLLKEQILLLKAENERLKMVVADLEKIVANLHEENNKLLKQLELLNKGGEK